MGRKAKLTPAHRRRAAELRAQGWTLSAIGAEFGVSRQAVHYLLAGGLCHPTAACCRCGSPVVSAGARPRDWGTTLCTACASRPGVAFGQRLQAHRLAAGLTRILLARRAGVALSSVAGYELGWHNPRAATLDKLARALGVSPEALAGAGREAKES
jgi:transcriptional regulator with XRE-family HTH domain